MSTYHVRRGFHLTEADATVLQKALNKLEKRLKRPWTPADVLADAKDPASPFHRFIEWDDSAAAVEYRLQQVRYIIRAISVVLPDFEMEVRANIPVSFRSDDDEDEPGGYMTTERALVDRPDVIAMQERRLRADAKRIAEEAGAWKAMLSKPAMQFIIAAERLAAA